jgi:hypothetical protein
LARSETPTETPNIYDAINNKPPVGVAHSDTDANNLKCLEPTPITAANRSSSPVGAQGTEPRPTLTNIKRARAAADLAK